MAPYNDEDVLIVLYQVFRHCEPLVGNTGKPAHSRLSRRGWETCRLQGVPPGMNPLTAKGRDVNRRLWPNSSEGY